MDLDILLLNNPLEILNIEGILTAFKCLFAGSALVACLSLGRDVHDILTVLAMHHAPSLYVALLLLLNLDVLSLDDHIAPNG